MKIYNKNNPQIKIRERLDELCNRTKHPYYDHILYKKVFFPEFANELKTILPPPKKEGKYNCFAYALGLDQSVTPYTFNQVIKNKDIVSTVMPKKGDIVAYYNGKYIMHAGRYESDSKVISKWGDGPIFLHDTFMCPANYGDNVGFFGKVPKDVAKKFILKYPCPN